MNDDIQGLPEEILRHIFQKLPLQSMLRFRGVCRRWRQQFDDGLIEEARVRDESRRLRALAVPPGNIRSLVEIAENSMPRGQTIGLTARLPNSRSVMVLVWYNRLLRVNNDEAYWTRERILQICAAEPY